MKIAIDVSPVSKSSISAHKVRGVGSYINLLIDNLEKYDKKNEYFFVENKKFPRDVDLIHIPYFDPFFITLPFMPQAKTVVTVHDLTPLVFPDKFPSGIKGKIRWAVQKKLLKKTTVVVTDSEKSKEDVVKIAGVEGEKVHSIYLSAGDEFKKIKSDDIRKSSALAKYNLPEKFILYVGDATWNKNLPNLINAVKKTKATLVITGKVWEQKMDSVSNNPWNDDLRKVMPEIESPQFIKLGFVSEDELVMLYNTADLLIMPSFYEGFGLPVLEAMSCGCPVITTKEGSLPEVAGSAAYYVNPYSIDSIAEGINNLVSDKQLLDEFRKRGVKQSKKFTTQNSIKRLVEVYESTN